MYTNLIEDRYASGNIRFTCRRLRPSAFLQHACRTHVEAREGDVVGARPNLRLNVRLLQVDRGVFPLL